MANTPQTDIPGLNQQISDLNKQAGTYQDSLNQSPTALGGQGVPTSSDISNQESLQRIQASIQKLNNQKIDAQWYPPNQATEEGQANPKVNPIGATLDFMARPLYGVVGAVKHFTGEGTDSLYKDVADNMTTNKDTFGNVLQKKGVPWAVSAPLGFALDVGMDPVNWLTMGEGALIPRIAEGAFAGFRSGEGIAEGISAAARSGVMEKAVGVGKYVPWLKDTEAFANLGSKTLQAVDEFQGITGKTAEALVVKGANYRQGWKNIIDKAAELMPGGQTFLENVKYDPASWIKNARLKDILQNSLDARFDTGAAVAESLKGGDIGQTMKKAGTEFASTIENAPGYGKEAVEGTFGINMDPNLTALTDKDIDQKMATLRSLGVEQPMRAVAPKIVSNIDDVASILKDPQIYISGDPYENARRIASETLNDPGITLKQISDVAKSGVLGQSGWKWYDDMMTGIRDFGSKMDAAGNKIPGAGKLVMDKYDQLMGVFRGAKVSASPVAWANAILGEGAMTHLGIEDLTPGFLARAKQVVGLYANKTDSAAFFDMLFMNAGGEGDVVRQYLKDFPTEARGLYGDTGFLGSKANADILLQTARDAGLAGVNIKAEDLAPELKKAIEELEKVKLTGPEAGKPFMQAGTEPVRDLLRAKKGVVNPLDVGTEMLNNDMFNSSATRSMLDHIAAQAKANPGNAAWRLLDFTFNNLSSGYTKAHQVFKMTTFVRAVEDGYDINQLRLASRLVDINPEDITRIAVDANGAKVAQVAGEAQKGIQYRYTLSPQAANNLSNALYINYSAMPAAIKVLRSMPLLGSPFVSFSYAMAMKTGQTLAYNPAAFNKIAFAMNEFGGTKTPLEKKAINDSSIDPNTGQPRNQYYGYLQDPGMYRLPDFLGNFFSKYPVYLNMSKMLPYLSLDMFDPSGADYGSSWRGQIAGAIQNSPFLKDPTGAAILQNLVVPTILGSTMQPQGQFGQPLYPIDANPLTKALYASRDYAESYVPGYVSYAGLLTPSAVSDYIPSYRWRKISNAMAGKNILGKSLSEPSTSQTVRAVLQATGIPVQSPVNTTFTAQGGN